MIKNIGITLLLSITLSNFALAQEGIPADTAGYESQRQKVNQLLTQRSARFGQFEESLQKRTGIFGLKTKRDMQASIDILKEIVLTDNNIFRETKLLLDYKEFEKGEVEKQALEFDRRINGYIATISKLQKEQAQLRAEIAALEETHQTSSGWLIFGLTILLLGGAGLFFVYRQRTTRTL